jgi:hypothetical protein
MLFWGGHLCASAVRICGLLFAIPAVQMSSREFFTAEAGFHPEGHERRRGHHGLHGYSEIFSHGLTQMGADNLIRKAGTQEPPPPFPDFLIS